jgi:SAM-dependent methyltransferase
MSVKKQWESLSQPGELKFHQKNEWRNSDNFMEETIELFDMFGYSRDDFEDGIVIDLGCGSKLRSKYFKKAKIVGIEPLADEFESTIDWSDLNEAYAVYSVPAEKMVKEVKGKASFVMCINVLDHTFDPMKILDNCYRYLDSEGEFLLSVDIHDDSDDLHPIHLTPDKLEKMILDTGFEIVREYIGLGEDRESYGHGVAYTYVLKRGGNRIIRKLSRIIKNITKKEYS